MALCTTLCLWVGMRRFGLEMLRGIKLEMGISSSGCWKELFGVFLRCLFNSSGVRLSFIWMFIILLSFEGYCIFCFCPETNIIISDSKGARKVQRKMKIKCNRRLKTSRELWNSLVSSFCKYLKAELKRKDKHRWMWWTDW